MALPKPTDLKHYLDVFEQCDICDYPVFTDNTRIKRHEPCQVQYEKAVTRRYNQLYRRLRKREDYDPAVGVKSVITEDDRDGVHARAREDARIWVNQQPTMIAALVEQSRRKQAEKTWERFLASMGGEEGVEDVTGMPVDVAAYEYEAGRVQFGYEDWEEQWGGTVDWDHWSAKAKRILDDQSS